MTKLRVENVSKHYGEVKALNHVNLSVNSGEFLVVMGQSGCGKSTLLLTILGAIEIEEGHIYLDEQVLDEVPIDARNLGYVPQDFGLFPHLTVYDNIAFGLKVREQQKEVIETKVTELLILVGLQGLEERKANELSGGEKQRVALARALAIHPSLLLLDEPLSNIDLSTKAEVRKNLKEIIKKTGITTLCVLHDPSDSLELGDRIAIMNHGEIIQCGTPNDVLTNPVNEFVRRSLTLWSASETKLTS